MGGNVITEALFARSATCVLSGHLLLVAQMRRTQVLLQAMLSRVEYILYTTWYSTPLPEGDLVEVALRVMVEEEREAMDCIVEVHRPYIQT